MPVHHRNWLQVQENTVDSVHTYYLHGHISALHDLPMMAQGRYFYRPIKSYDWAVSPWGIDKSVVYGGDAPELEIRPPLIFPNILRIPEGPVEALHFRVPIDDTHTRIIWVGLRPSKDGAKAPADAATPFEYSVEKPHASDQSDLQTFYGQDRVVWETQGVIFDRTQEVLGASDRGIVMFRRMLAEQIERVEAGGDPNVAVVRDPGENEIIAFESATRPASTAKSISSSRRDEDEYGRHLMAEIIGLGLSHYPGPTVPVRHCSGRFTEWGKITQEEIEDSGQHEVLNWICLAGAMTELGQPAEVVDFVETYVFNSAKCFAVFSPNARSGKESASRSRAVVS